jgi:hypothetical protein
VQMQERQQSSGRNEVEVDGSDEVTNKSQNSRLSAVPGYACLVDLTNTVVSERWHYQT